MCSSLSFASLSRFFFCHFSWRSSDGTFEKNPNRLVCFVALVKEVGGKSESEERGELSPETQGELTSEGRAELASDGSTEPASDGRAELAPDGNTDGGGWSTNKS